MRVNPVKELQSPVITLERAGKYLVRSRAVPLVKIRTFTALSASRDPDPTMQALALLSVALARVCKAKHDGWVDEVCENLHLAPAGTEGPLLAVEKVLGSRKS